MSCQDLVIMTGKVTADTHSDSFQGMDSEGTNNSLNSNFEIRELWGNCW